jgi:hypothetical protein
VGCIVDGGLTDGTKTRVRKAGFDLISCVQRGREV